MTKIFPVGVQIGGEQEYSTGNPSLTVGKGRGPVVYSGPSIGEV